MQALNNRPQGSQKNDCTVRALATVCNRDYWEVLATLRAEGRKDNRGFLLYDWIDANEGRVFGCQFTRIRTLWDKGIFLCGTQGHVWARVNGQWVDDSDWFSKRKRIVISYCYIVERNAYPYEPPKAISMLIED